MWPFKKKAKKIESENLKVSENFAEILSANKQLEDQFKDLIKRFENRIWTPEVCHLFKLFAEDLFSRYGLIVEFSPNASSSGSGTFNVKVVGSTIDQDQSSS